MDDKTKLQVQSLIAKAEEKLKEAKEDALNATKAHIDVKESVILIRELEAQITRLKSIYS